MPFTSIARRSGRRSPLGWSTLLVRSACGAGIPRRRPRPRGLWRALRGRRRPGGEAAHRGCRPEPLRGCQHVSDRRPGGRLLHRAANPATIPGRPLHALAHPTPVRVRGPSDLPKPPPRSTGVTSPSASDPYSAARVKGATAVCADGSWSRATNRAGACVARGGVHRWTGNLGAAGPGGH
jgi:hypothetical protein